METIERNEPPRECRCGRFEFDIEPAEDTYEIGGEARTDLIGDVYTCVHCGQEYHIYNF